MNKWTQWWSWRRTLKECEDPSTHASGRNPALARGPRGGQRRSCVRAFRNLFRTPLYACRCRQLEESDDDDDNIQGSIDNAQDRNSSDQKARYKGLRIKDELRLCRSVPHGLSPQRKTPPVDLLLQLSACLFPRPSSKQSGKSPMQHSEVVLDLLPSVLVVPLVLL